MNKKHKVYLRLNLMSVFFVVVSFISVTLAWFAYSGLAEANLEVNVKAWYVELSKDGEVVTHEIKISLDEIHPGMETITEIVNIKNKGDSNAQVKYSITSARILGKDEDNYDEIDINDSKYIEDKLSHDYPFHININIGKNYILTGEDETTFEVSISWPLDSDDDIVDSTWGTDAYLFQQNEEALRQQDENYQIRPSIKVVINLAAEQYLEESTSSDIRYNAGDIILFDVVNNNRCESISPTCLKTYVIDENNTLGDETVTLLPDPMSDYLNGHFSDYASLLSTTTQNWEVDVRSLSVEDILAIISTDIIDSVLVRENISDIIIGNLSYPERINTEINRMTNYNGHYKFLNEKFNYLSSVNCYWISSQYNSTKGFAVKKENDLSSIVYGEDKNANCNIIPVIIANKLNL